MPKPFIGLTPAYDQEKAVYRLGREYFEAVRAADGVPFLLEMTADEKMLKQYMTICAGFIFTGGCDLDPQSYGQAKSAECGDTMPFRDRFEMKLLKAALAADKPILAICRGNQLVNVAFGGTLYQHLPQDYPSAVSHRQPEPYDTPWHQVTLTKDNALSKLLGGELMVNSYHHQGVARLGQGLIAAAYSPDGLVEALAISGKPHFFSVQWHPERLYQFDEASLKLFQQLVYLAQKGN